MKAKAVGLIAQDYTTDHVNVDQYTGMRIYEGVDSGFIDKLYSSGTLEAPDFIREELDINEFAILRNGKHSALIGYDKPMNKIHIIFKKNAYGIIPRNAGQIFALQVLCNNNIPLVTICGKAGTGKTLLALAASLERSNLYKQIFLARPIVALSDKDIGFLPGEVGAKIGPYMQPLFDNLTVIRNQFDEDDGMNMRIEQMLKDNVLIIEPLAFIRGRSLPKMFVIIDEAQNFTSLEIKTIITRAGEGTKIVFTGDIHQIDHPYLDKHSNGLSYVIEKMRGHSMYAHITLTKGERSPLAELASDIL
jgi:PhoH-like ATPase